MVFAKALPFARISLGKTISHGYAQSLVATSHSWNATQTLQNRFQKNQPLVYNTAPGGLYKSVREANGELVDYLKEWHSQKLGGANWRQYQFAKRIEWKPHTLPEDHQDASDAQQHKTQQIDESTARTPVSPHDSAVSGLSSGIRDDALAKLDEALFEVENSQQSDSEVAIQHTVAKPIDSTLGVSPASLAYADQLNKLADSKHYAEIPAVFESMLNKDIIPTASAYNALLAAAIHLPRRRSEAVNKALDVYGDMLQRRVLPDITTYTIMIELLSAQALSVYSARNALEDRRARYGGFEQNGKFMFRSSENEQNILNRDDSLEAALRFFDAATAIYPQGPFSERTFRLLVSACAENNKIPDMVNVFSRMDRQHIVPRADMFVHMIPGFARFGDMANAVEMYNEYKQLAIANNSGELEIVRKDNDVYAAMVRSYIISGDLPAATKFVAKLERTSSDAQFLGNLQDTVGLKGFLPEWLKTGSLDSAFDHVNERLTSAAKDIGFAAVCIRAADRNNLDIAVKAFNSLSGKADIIEPALALSALQIRNRDIPEAEKYWKLIEHVPARLEFIELGTMHALAAIESGQPTSGLHLWRSVFERVRSRFGTKPQVLSQVDESIELVVKSMISRGIILPAPATMQLVNAMLENHGAIPSVAVHLLAGFGPEEIVQLDLTSLQTLLQVQAHIIIDGTSQDIASSARFTHMLDLLLAGGVEPAFETSQAISNALVKLNRPDISARWVSRHAIREPVYAAAPYSPFATSPVIQSNIDETTDPYYATTDNKGSVVITDLLEKPQGHFTSQVNEALTRFKNMRRAGRHPRFFTYAKLIAATAKDGKMQIAYDVLALARQDVPYLAQYRIVRFGWQSILDAMVAACLQSGERQQAEQFHQELLSMGMSPSSNTFGLYITTLSSSTKTFDEASEAVKIFMRAKAEQVEPSSFLYNALIGKLGKARRIDDCLFYFNEMRSLGIRPTSVTYGTIVNALCRVSDEKFAEELFDEMEAMPNYKARPAPYHSMMQFFLSTKRDRAKVLKYYDRMQARNIMPTSHTFKLLIDAHASLEPLDMAAAEQVLEQIRTAGMQPDAVHYAALIHAYGCVAHDMTAAQKLFDSVLADRYSRPQACLYQALFEGMVANHTVGNSVVILQDMYRHGVALTPYIANALIHGWALEGDIGQSEAIFKSLSSDKREPSTYEAMTRAYVVADMRDKAMGVVNEALARSYPTAVIGKIVDLVGGGKALSESS